MVTAIFSQTLDKLTRGELTELSLIGELLTSAQFKSLFEVLKTNTSLKKLDLSGTGLGAEDVRYLSLAISTNTTLTKLNLANNFISDLGAQFLAEALELNTSITWIDLWQNRITGEGIRSLTKAVLGKNKSIECINLHDNSGNYQLVEEIDRFLLNRRNQHEFFSSKIAGIQEEKIHPFLCMSNY